MSEDALSRDRMPGETQVSAASSTADQPRTRYLTRSATRKGTADISHFLLQKLPATARATRTTRGTTPATITTEPKSRKPFIEALNRVATSSGSTQPTPTLSTEIKKSQNEDPFTAVISPAKGLPMNRKRRSAGLVSSPRGTENSPNTRPRKVARMPRSSVTTFSPFKPTINRSSIQFDATSATLPAGTKLEPESRPRPMIRSPPSLGQTRGEPSAIAKPEPVSPAKVPVGSATPFRFGTNRILDVPLSAVKKGARWSLASDLSDDSLLLQASPKKPTNQIKSALPLRESIGTSPCQSQQDETEKRGTIRHPTRRTEETEAEDFELQFLEDSKDDIQVDRGEKDNIVDSLVRPLSKVSIDRQRKSAPQKTSTARIVHRAQKSLSLPRTTSSYAQPTQSSAKAASVTAAAMDARASLKNVIREPSRKPISTPAAQIMTSSKEFARPCGVQSRGLTLAHNNKLPTLGHSTNTSSFRSGVIDNSAKKSSLKSRSYIPIISPVRERNPNLPSEATKEIGRQSKPIAIGSTSSTLTSNARRKSLTMETSKSLYSLSAALAKLTVKRPSLEGKSPDPEPSSLTQHTRNPSGQPGSTNYGTRATNQTTTSTFQPSKPVAISRIPKSTSIHGRSSLSEMTLTSRGQSGDKENAMDRNMSSGLKNTPRDTSVIVSNNTILKGVTAFVDVRTAEGDDTSAVFAEMLRACGARVLSKPTESCTHIIFKSGKMSTLVWWRKQPVPKPHIVGIGWVTRCRDSGQRVPEEPFEVDVSAQAVFQKRRKSMEPRQLQALMGTSLESLGSSSITAAHTSNIAQARRMSMHFGQTGHGQA